MEFDGFLQQQEEATSTRLQEHSTPMYAIYGDNPDEGGIVFQSWQSELDVCSQNSCSYSFCRENDENFYQQMDTAGSSSADNIEDHQMMVSAKTNCMVHPRHQQQHPLQPPPPPPQQQHCLDMLLQSSSPSSAFYFPDEQYYLSPTVPPPEELFHHHQNEADLEWQMIQYESLPALLQVESFQVHEDCRNKGELLEDITGEHSAAAGASLSDECTSIMITGSPAIPPRKRARSGGCFTLESVTESVRRQGRCHNQAAGDLSQAMAQLNGTTSTTTVKLSAATATTTLSATSRYQSKKQLLQSGGGGSVEPQSIAARQRRKKISERVRELEKLVPGGNKLDTASMLDEAFKFVKFLQIQVQLLDAVGSLPPSSHGTSLPPTPSRKIPFQLPPPPEYSRKTSSSSPLVLTETLQHVLFKHRRCIATLQQQSELGSLKYEST